MMWIFILVILGIFFWLINLRILLLSRDWPLILIIFGIINMCSLFLRHKRKSIIRDLEKGKISVQEAERRLGKTN